MNTAQSTPKLALLRTELRSLASPAQARLLSRFFKTGPGEYGEGDQFLGLKVPVTRQVARKYRDLRLPQVRNLLRSPIHEERLAALLILVDRFGRGDEGEQARIYRLYLANTRFVNNWDLVDLSAPRIVGGYLLDRPRDPLLALARSTLLWERRIAVLAAGWFIRQGELTPTLRLARMLLDDEHDLIHKAVGWMLREVGKRDQGLLEEFLGQHASRMPRTMLRYAIERFPPRLRAHYMRVSTSRKSPCRKITSAAPAASI